MLSEIDRVLGNSAWEDLFPSVHVSFLPEGDYDHSPMLVQFLQSTQGHKPFRFFNYWTERENFPEVVGEVWDVRIEGILVISSLRS